MEISSGLIALTSFGSVATKCLRKYLSVGIVAEEMAAMSCRGCDLCASNAINDRTPGTEQRKNLGSDLVEVSIK